MNVSVFFRRLLIRIGKVLPFVFSAIVLFGYFENIYSVFTERYIEYIDGTIVYDCYYSTIISRIVYIDWVDVLLLYILAFALEFCKWNFFAVHYLFVNLLVRYLLESVTFEETTILIICAIMSILGIVAVYGGFKMIPAQKGKF